MLPCFLHFFFHLVEETLNQKYEKFKITKPVNLNSYKEYKWKAEPSATAGSWNLSKRSKNPYSNGHFRIESYHWSNPELTSK
jgi:hypothetical protein